MECDNKIFLAEIQEYIDEHIRPALLAHFGDISIASFENGILQFRLGGNCSGCPSAWLTAEEAVKKPLMERFPKLQDVVVNNDLDDGMIQLARDVLSGKKKFSP